MVPGKGKKHGVWDDPPQQPPQVAQHTAARKGPKSLLDDDDDQINADVGGIKINESYAKRFEHNKKREELHRLQAKHPELAERLERQAFKHSVGADAAYNLTDDSTSEDEDDGYIPETTEAKIFETLLKIRSKDPSIYDSNVKFFTEEEGEGEDGADDEGGIKAKRNKPKYLREVLAEQALQHGAEGATSSDEEEGGKRVDEARPPKVYDREQADIRAAFLSAAEAAVDGDAEQGEFGGMLKRRPGKAGAPGDTSDEDQGNDTHTTKTKGKKTGKKTVRKLVDRYFESSGDAADAFLRDYILNQAWVDREDTQVPSYTQIIGDSQDKDINDDEDEMHLEETDKYEAAYNFRFEEPGGAAIVSHPRQVDGSVRRPDDRRKKSRDAKKERQREAEAQREEEIKRLKNLKKKEIEERLSKVARVAGAALPEGSADNKGGTTKGANRKGGLAALRLDPSLLEGDFDPEEWDRQMAAAFNDEYYEGEDEDLDALLGDDDSDAENDLMTDDLLADQGDVGKLVGGLSDEDTTDNSTTDDDDMGEGNEDGLTGFKALRKKLKARNAQGAQQGEGLSEGGDEEGPEEADEGVLGGGDDRDEQAVAAAAAARAELNRLLEEYYKLDYEGVAGGLKTRFKYREVPAADYGLSVDDILQHSDKDLNQVVGLKRLAPYRDDAGPKSQRPNYKALQELKKQPPAPKAGGVNKQRKWHTKRPQHHEPSSANGIESEQPLGEPQGRPGHQQGHTQHKKGDKQQKSGHGEPGKDRAWQPKHTPHHRGDHKHSKQAGGAENGSGPGAAGRHSHQQGAGKAQQAGKPPLDDLAARKASYAPLGGFKQGGGAAQQGGQHKGQKRPAGDQGANGPKRHKAGNGEGASESASAGAGAEAPSDGLTKAQRKNMKRAAKRAAKKANAGAGATVAD